MNEIKKRALAVVSIDATQMSGMDDQQLRALVDLGDKAGEIADLVDEADTLKEALALATTSLCELKRGRAAADLLSPQGRGVDMLLVELVTLLRAHGVDDGGAWDTEATRCIPVAPQQTAVPAFLPAGTVIVSIKGDSSSVDDEDEVSTGPMAEGYIDVVYPNQEECYSVVFHQSGVSIFLNKKELADAGSYLVKPPLLDGEILGFDGDPDADGDRFLAQWDAGTARVYCSSETLAHYGLANLRERELSRVGVEKWDWLLAQTFPRALSTSERLLDAARADGLVISAWNINDLDFLDDDVDTIDLDDGQLIALKAALLASAGRDLVAALATLGNEKLADHWEANKHALLKQLP